jgi:hypothetical protein
LQKLPVSPALIALNPGKRIGFVPVIVERHEFLELPSCTYSTGAAFSENHFQGQLNLPGSVRIGGL